MLGSFQKHPANTARKARKDGRLYRLAQSVQTVHMSPMVRAPAIEKSRTAIFHMPMLLTPLAGFRNGHHRFGYREARTALPSSLMDSISD